MVESSSPDITLKEEPVTLDRPESPNPSYLPFRKKVLPDSKIWVSTPAREVRGEISITTFRNALRAQYLSHSSMYVSTLRNNCQIIQCLGGKIGGLDQISNKDAIILYCLENGVQVDYAKIIWKDLIHKLNKKTREKIVPYPSVHNLILKPNQPKEPSFTDHMKAICNLDVPVDSKAPKYSSPTEEKKTKSNSAMDTSPSHPSPHTLVVGEIYKEAQQAAGDPTSLGDTRSNLSVLVDKTKSARDRLKNTHTTSSANKESGADDISRKVKVEDLVDILKDTRSAFFTPDSSTYEPIIVLDENLRTLDSLPRLLRTVNNTLNRFATLVENASGATTTGVLFADKATALPAEGENVADTNLKMN
nr:hypothetical protein [Tanacetum cinerariifolium]